MPEWSTVLSKLTEVTGQDFPSYRVRTITGGCINEAVVLESGGRRFFVKHGNPGCLDMFAAEAEGLEALAATKAVRVPASFCCGGGHDTAFLVLEYLELSAMRAEGESTLGRQLATLHRTTQRRFGWHRANTIGTTPQINTYSDDWVEFFRDRRLDFQLELAGHHGYRRLHANGEQLLSRLELFFEGHAPQASLLHGDLWAGNVGATTAGKPVIFDPAVYYGDRETDLAMTELFGGFSDTFYRSYNEVWPLASDYGARKMLYNLYHILNHLNLFGRGYLAQAERTVSQLLANVR
jgi:protein-ribulosamine 3-kinase